MNKPIRYRIISRGDEKQGRWFQLQRRSFFLTILPYWENVSTHSSMDAAYEYSGHDAEIVRWNEKSIWNIHEFDA
jgi:hypothetical protein